MSNKAEELLSGNVRVKQQGSEPLPQTEELSFTTRMQNKISGFLNNNLLQGDGLIATLAHKLGFGESGDPKTEMVVNPQKAPAPANNPESGGLFSNLGQKLSSVAAGKKEEWKLFPTTKEINPKVKSSIEEAVVGLDIKPNMGDNQIARHVAQKKFSSAKENGHSQDYLLSLISEGEGFRNNLYRDNKGLAYGVGWNVSMQSKDFNTYLMKAVTDNKSAIEKIVGYSNTPKEYEPGKYGDTNTAMPYQRFAQASLLIADDFKQNGVLVALEKSMKNNPKGREYIKSHGGDSKEATRQMFESLDPNVQAGLVYHSYKVGKGGYGMYSNLNQSVVEYGVKDPAQRTQADRTKIAGNISYTYMLNGEKLRDTRAEIKVAAMISDPDSYGSTIQSMPAKKNLSDYVPQMKKNNVSVGADGTVNIPDPYGDKIKALNNSGVKIQQDFDFADVNNRLDKLQPKPGSSYKTGKGMQSYSPF